MKVSGGASLESADAMIQRTRPGAGAISTSSLAGYALVGTMLVLFALTTAGLWFGNHLLGRFIDQNQEREEQALRHLGAWFHAAVENSQAIPGPTNWVSALAPFAALDPAGLQQVHPEYGTDLSLNRAFLVDPNLPPGVLPYVQPAEGLTGDATNLLGASARILILSSAKRGLALPFDSGTVDLGSFNRIWDWNYVANAREPPAGWPPEWTGAGQFLHVERINLRNLFHRVLLRNLWYGTRGPDSLSNRVGASGVALQLLHGTPLTLAALDGVIRRAHVVTRDVEIDLGTNGLGPLVFYRFSEPHGSIATNAGRLGELGHGHYTNGVLLGTAGPRAPVNLGYPADNSGIALDGADDFVEGPPGLLNGVSGFTMAGWIKPATEDLKRVDLFGQEGIAQVGFTTPSRKLELRCDNDAKKLHYFYPYGAGEWHHIAAVGDGATMQLYVDAVLVASRTYFTADYGTNSSAFNVGGNVFGPGQYFSGNLDEVVVYDYALGSSDIARLFANDPP